MTAVYATLKHHKSHEAGLAQFQKCHTNVGYEYFVIDAAQFRIWTKLIVNVVKEFHPK